MDSIRDYGCLNFAEIVAISIFRWDINLEFNFSETNKTVALAGFSH